MTLELNGLSVDCIIGDLPAERRAPQRLRVDLALEIDDAAAQSDRLADTVDYARLAADVRAALAAAKPQLIERAAKIAYEAARRDGRVRRATVKVTKFGAIPQLESASATYDGGL